MVVVVVVVVVVVIDTYGGCGRVGLEKVPLSLSGPACAVSTRLQPTSDFYQLFQFRLQLSA